MPFAGFHQYFPEVAARETRSIHIPPSKDLPLPGGEYAFVEMFCDERGCDCRRVFFYVISPDHKGPLAVVAYGWEPLAFYAKWIRYGDKAMSADLKGPSLSRLSPQSALAPAILDLTENVLLKDKLYIERLKRHYRMFRDRIEKRKPSAKSLKRKPPKREK